MNLSTFTLNTIKIVGGLISFLIIGLVIAIIPSPYYAGKRSAQHDYEFSTFSEKAKLVKDIDYTTTIAYRECSQKLNDCVCKQDVKQVDDDLLKLSTLAVADDFIYHDMVAVLTRSNKEVLDSDSRTKIKQITNYYYGQLQNEGQRNLGLKTLDDYYLY